MLGSFPRDIFPGGNFPKVRPSEAPLAAKGGLAQRLGSAMGPSATAKIGRGVVCCGLDSVGKLPLGK